MRRTTKPIGMLVDYFGQSYELPIITWHFYPERGWKRQTFRKRVSRAWLRKIRASEGATHVGLTLNGRTADFSIQELLRPCNAR